MNFFTRIAHSLLKPFKYVYESDFYLLLGNTRFITRYLKREKILTIYELKNYKNWQRCLITGYKRGFKLAIRSLLLLILISILLKSVSFYDILLQTVSALFGGSFIYFFIGALLVKRSLIREEKRLQNIKENYNKIEQQKYNNIVLLLNTQHIDINLGSIDLNKKIPNLLKEKLQNHEAYAIENIILSYANLESLHKGNMVDTFILHPQFARLLDAELQQIILKDKTNQIYANEFQ